MSKKRIYQRKESQAKYLKTVPDHAILVNEHIPYKSIPYYTMPIDYLEIMLGDRLQVFCKYANCFNLNKTGSFVSDLQARRLHEASHGALYMLPLKRHIKNYTERELIERCKKIKHYQLAYEKKLKPYQNY